MKEQIGGVKAVKFTGSLVDAAVCLTSEGDLSVEMAKTLKRMPGTEDGIPEVNVVLEINMNHPVAARLKELYTTDKDKLAEYAKLLYHIACLVGGIGVTDPEEMTRLITGLMI